MRHKKGLIVGDRVYLKYDMLNQHGQIIPAGTLGSVEQFKEGVPQVYLGERHGVKAAAPHYLTVIDARDGAPLPEDGTLVQVEDLVATVNALAWDNYCLRRQIGVLAAQRVTFGRS